jgi:hypothetical protein
MVGVASFVETFYPSIAPIVIFAAIFWFVLGHDKSLFLPLVGCVVLVFTLSGVSGLFRIFLISLPSMIVGLTLHLLFAAWLLPPFRKLVQRLVYENVRPS